MTTRRTLFVAVAAFAGSLASVKSALAQAAQEPAKQADFLFVQTAKAMTFDKSASKLTLDGVSQVIVIFSDRPESIATNMRTAAFEPFWRKGKDSFLSIKFADKNSLGSSRPRRGLLRSLCGLPRPAKLVLRASD